VNRPDLSTLTALAFDDDPDNRIAEQWSAEWQASGRGNSWT
jgi:hypothetical protein